MFYILKITKTKEVTYKKIRNISDLSKYDLHEMFENYYPKRTYMKFECLPVCNYLSLLGNGDILYVVNINNEINGIVSPAIINHLRREARNEKIDIILLNDN